MCCVLYKVRARNDVTAQICPIGSYNGGSGINLADVTTTFVNSYNESTSTSATISTIPIGTTPYMLNQFCCYFKIIGKPREIRIPGGGYKNYTVKDPRWRMWNGAKIAGCSGAVNAVDVAFKNRTTWIFGLTYGAPVSDSTNANNVAPGPVRLLTLSQESYEYTGTVNTISRLQPPLNNFPTISASNVSTVTLQTEEKESFVFA